jgi:hypothetical protein
MTDEVEVFQLGKSNKHAVTVHAVTLTMNTCSAAEWNDESLDQQNTRAPKISSVFHILLLNRGGRTRSVLKVKVILSPLFSPLKDVFFTFTRQNNTQTVLIVFRRLQRFKKLNQSTEIFVQSYLKSVPLLKSTNMYTFHLSSSNGDKIVMINGF